MECGHACGCLPRVSVALLRGWAAATLSRHIAAGPTADTTGNATTRRALARSVFAPTHPLPPTPFCCPPPLSSIISISPPFMSLYSPIPPALSASLLHLLTAGGAHGDGAVRWPDWAPCLRRRCVRACCMLSPRHDACVVNLPPFLQCVTHATGRHAGATWIPLGSGGCLVDEYLNEACQSRRFATVQNLSEGTMHQMAVDKAGSTDDDRGGGALFEYANAGARYTRSWRMRSLQSQRRRPGRLLR
ncbi:hypothetical protein BU14_0458s0002 [Porphyra umbilicalis]|uniref:Uncharacterized protein n=1 Tax=Porphyra umbilicalis TaxID=2786 RepID=A0A1X6NUD8_PORUM|nr:hypothetical protein BU14_0458s0002 [Porphyra umbilicalis]|eukprot:OSX72202.1 hypothetical protein BU14_0458s0002 [Porphyra umbilicalis]